MRNMCLNLFRTLFFFSVSKLCLCGNSFFFWYQSVWCLVFVKEVKYNVFFGFHFLATVFKQILLLLLKNVKLRLSLVISNLFMREIILVFCFVKYSSG